MAPQSSLEDVVWEALQAPNQQGSQLSDSTGLTIELDTGNPCPQIQEPSHTAPSPREGSQLNANSSEQPLARCTATAMICLM